MWVKCPTDSDLINVFENYEKQLVHVSLENDQVVFPKCW